MTRYWSVHMVPGDDYEDLLANKEYLAIFYNIDDLFDVLADSLVEEDSEEYFTNKIDEILRDRYPDRNNKQIASYRKYFVYFVYEMAIGDVIISVAFDETCYLGYVSSDYLFTNDMHLRKVNWRPISRLDLSPELKSVIGRQATVRNLDHYRIELTNLLLKYNC